MAGELVPGQPGIVSASEFVAASPAGKSKATVAKKLVQIVERQYEIKADSAGHAYAIPRRGPAIALQLKGGGEALRGQLVQAFYEQNGTFPNNATLSSLMTYLANRASEQPRVQVDLRCARTENGLTIDLGDSTGRVVNVTAAGWRVAKRPPDGVLFRRTHLTAPLPRPSRRGDLDLLRDLINVTGESWALVRAWLVMAWRPDIPVPILCVTGRQGAGKSVLGRLLVNVVDPSTAPLRSPPRRDDWQTVAASSRVVVIDNVSRISPDWSDDLCRLVTGDAAAKRALYTDDDLHVAAFRRVGLLTSIDPGALRGDLSERLMPIELRPLGKRRRDEAGIDAAFRRDAPRILGGLLDLVVQTLANPGEAPNPPRMADAANIMASVDRAVGSQSLAAYRRGQATLTMQVLEGDPVAARLVGFLRTKKGYWKGTPGALLAHLLPPPGEQRQWPATPRGLSQRIWRLEPALRDAHGIRIRKGRSRERYIELEWPAVPETEKRS